MFGKRNLEWWSKIINHNRKQQEEGVDTPQSINLHCGQLRTHIAYEAAIYGIYITPLLSSLFYGLALVRCLRLWELSVYNFRLY